jgi:ATP-binding cassette subfamily F protein 3
LKYYKGNYDTFEKTRLDANLNQTKQHEKQQANIEKSQAFIDKFRANAKRASMVQSKIKLLAKVEVVEKVVEDSSISFRFPPPGVLKPPCLRLE